MDYAAIATELTRHGVRVTPDAVQRAEWQARVHLDDQVFARAAGASTETQASATRYLRFVLEGLGVADGNTVEQVAEWRRGYNPPVGLWTTCDPQAHEALALVRTSGARSAAVSNSNGTVESVLAAVGVRSSLDFVIDSGTVGVEKPNPRIFELALARAGVGAAEAAYIGDFYSIDVRGARSALGGPAGAQLVVAPANLSRAESPDSGSARRRSRASSPRSRGRCGLRT